jgi:hypothetical protein
MVIYNIPLPGGAIAPPGNRMLNLRERKPFYGWYVPLMIAKYISWLKSWG